MNTDTLRSAVAPRVDIFETPEAFVIEAELPGVAVEDVRVEIREGKLYLFGSPREGDIDAKTHRSERPRADFGRVFSLSRDVDASRVEARMRDGVLTLRLGKAAHARRHLVSLN